MTARPTRHEGLLATHKRVSPEMLRHTYGPTRAGGMGASASLATQLRALRGVVLRTRSLAASVHTHVSDDGSPVPYRADGRDHRTTSCCCVDTVLWATPKDRSSLPGRSAPEMLHFAHCDASSGLVDSASLADELSGLCASRRVLMHSSRAGYTSRLVPE